MVKKNSPLSPERTLASRIYQHLKDAIIECKIKPGQKIPEKDIIKLFNSSITPVREAVVRLSAEGFLDIGPKRSVIVKATSLEDYVFLQEAIVLLDSYVSTQAMYVMTNEDLRVLKEKTNEMEVYCNKDNNKKYLETNFEIHDYIFNLCQNRYSIINRVWEDYKRNTYHLLQRQYDANNQLMKKFCEIHKELIQVFKSRNESRLRSIVKDHWIMFP